MIEYQEANNGIFMPKMKIAIESNTIPEPLKPEDYYDGQGKEYIDSRRRCWCCVEVLPFLKGLPWDEYALAWVHSVRPSMIRVSIGGGGTCDCRTWRVTVNVDKNNIIQEIEQEVELSGTDECPTGYDMRNKLYKLGVEI